MTSKFFVYSAALAIFIICTYLLLKGIKVFEGKFEDNPFAWYFFAKGIFCSVSLVLSREILQVLRDKKF
jgi:hypothetical protein